MRLKNAFLKLSLVLVGSAIGISGCYGTLTETLIRNHSDYRDLCQVRSFAKQALRLQYTAPVRQELVIASTGL